MKFVYVQPCWWTGPRYRKWFRKYLYQVIFKLICLAWHPWLLAWHPRWDKIFFCFAQYSQIVTPMRTSDMLCRLTSWRATAIEPCVWEFENRRASTAQVRDQVPFFCFLNSIDFCLSLLTRQTNFQFILKSCFLIREWKDFYFCLLRLQILWNHSILNVKSSERHRSMRSLANDVIVSCAEYDLGYMFHVLGRGTLVTLRFLSQDLNPVVEQSYLSFQVFTSSLRLFVMTWLLAADLTVSATASPKSAKSSSLLLSSCMVKTAMSGVFWMRSSTIWTLGLVFWMMSSNDFLTWGFRDQGGQAECPE